MSYLNVYSASFRGVKFFCESDSVTQGRRTKYVPYAFGKGFVDDTGYDEPDITISAYIGRSTLFPDPDAQARRLVNALNKKGSGLLVHPTLGYMNVVAGKHTMSASHNQSGIIKFSLQFYKSTENSLGFGRGRSTLIELLGLTTNLLDLSRILINSSMIFGGSAATISAVTSRFFPISEQIEVLFPYKDVKKQMQDFRSGLIPSFATGGDYGGNVVGLFNILRTANISDNGREQAGSFFNLFPNAVVLQNGTKGIPYDDIFEGIKSIYNESIRDLEPVLIDIPDTLDYQNRNKNTQIIEDMGRLIISSIVFESIAGKNYRFVQELEDARRFSEDIFELVIDSETPTHEMKILLTELRVKSYEILEEKINTLPNIDSFRTESKEPLISLAHRLYYDEIIKENNAEDSSLDYYFKSLYDLNIGKNSTYTDKEVKVLEL